MISFLVLVMRERLHVFSRSAFEGFVGVEQAGEQKEAFRQWHRVVDRQVGGCRIDLTPRWIVDHASREVSAEVNVTSSCSLVLAFCVTE